MQSNVDQEEGEVFTDLFSVEDGIILDADAPQRCQQDPVEAGHPGRQHMITKVGVLSFFESNFAATAQRRARCWSGQQCLHQDFLEARYREAVVHSN